MEPRKLLLSDQYCRGCHSPHTLDENMRCEFCRRAPAEPRRGLIVRVWRSIVELFAPRQEDTSIFKEPA